MIPLAGLVPAVVTQSAAPEEVEVGPGVERMQCYTGNCTTAAACRQLSLVQDCPDGGEHDACITTIEQKGDIMLCFLAESEFGVGSITDHDYRGITVSQGMPPLLLRFVI